MSRIALLSVLCAMVPTLASANLATYRCLLFSKKADTCRIRIGINDDRLLTYEVHCLKGPRFAATNIERYQIELRPENGYVLKIGYPADHEHAHKYFTIHVKTQKPGTGWPDPSGLYKSNMNFEQELALEDAGDFVPALDNDHSCPVVRPYPIDDQTLRGFCNVAPNE